VPRLPLISALMPAFTAERFIAEAIQSALDQDYPADRLELVVGADASDLLATPELLVAWGRAMASVSDITLAIDASSLPPDIAAGALADLVGAVGLADDDSIDLLAVLGPLDAVGRARLAAGTHARYGAAPTAFTPATLDDLRALI
jgi:hypothetical protein